MSLTSAVDPLFWVPIVTSLVLLGVAAVANILNKQINKVQRTKRLK